MKIKTDEASGVVLDWAVAKCEDETDVLFAYRQYGKLLVRQAGCHETHDSEWPYEPSTDWSQGGPIIEREKIGSLHEARGVWSASTKWEDPAKVFYGKTKLIAAMRCYVASKLGAEVEIPEELAP